VVRGYWIGWIGANPHHQRASSLLDGQAGNILMAYRDFLNTGNTQWLSDKLGRIKPV